MIRQWGWLALAAAGIAAVDSCHIASLPTTYVLDETGIVAWRKLGPVTRAELEDERGLANAPADDLPGIQEAFK
ncbi:TlpA family protein disulfide reductase [Cohnella fermenti]|uniref:Uncharacterized protein n=1 Tax=Cohnella fermenti TaxID=2565925 RepID=A0A4S4C6I7_9BACL|nr:hypothetical protein [Cohnella fermenti]THF83520.1 hypothetical protein E6C55_05020 [Cohnella fermenti]